MTTLKVSSPAELISAVPFLIGFHPSDSLTVVAMHGPLITFAVRMDLPGHGAPDEEVEAAALHLATVVLRQSVQAVTIIGYGDEPRATPAVSRISDILRKAALVIVDELRVEDGRYWSYLCTDLSCCPTEGRPCQPSNSVVAAAATFAGAVALPNREALEAQLAPVTGDDREAMTAATGRAVRRLAALAGERPPPPAPATDRAAGRVAPRSPAEAARGPKVPDAGRGPGRPRSAELSLSSAIGARLGIVPPVPDEPEPGAEGTESLPNEEYFFALARNAGRVAVQEAERCYSTGGRLTDDAAAWLGLLLLHIPIRDYAWTRTRTREWELALWSDLTRRVEPRYLPAPAALLAFVAWRSGLGPLASIAVERTLAQRPDYSLALLLQRALVVGLPPSVLDGWPAVEGLALVDDCPYSEDDCPDSEEEEAEPDEIVGPGRTPGFGPHRPAGNGGGPGRPQPEGRTENHQAEQEETPPVEYEKSQPAEQTTAQPAGREMTRPDGQEKAQSAGRRTGRSAGREKTQPARQEKTKSMGEEMTQRVGGEVKAPLLGHGGQLPARIRSDVPPAGAQDRAGDRPEGRASRQRNPRRTARRRI